jgi:hypothetical protein
MGCAHRIEQLQDIQPWIADHASSELPKRLVYVYYCEICNSVLALRGNLDCLQSFLYTTADECPTCHFRLDLSLRCRALSIIAPLDLLTVNSLRPKTPHHVMTSVFPTLEINGVKQSEDALLSFGDNSLDELCGGVHTRQLTVLYGGKICQAIAEQLCVRAQLPIEIGGLNAKSVFIDGGNTFDLYHISNYAATLHLDRDEILHGIGVSRAFTCYQLVSLIVEKLPQLLREKRIGVVIISNILDLFMDSEVDLTEIKQAVNFLLNFLTQFARENRIALVVTCSAHKGDCDTFLRQLLTSRAQTVLKTERRGREANIALEKHPTKQQASRTVTLPVCGIL